MRQFIGGSVLLMIIIIIVLLFRAVDNSIEEEFEQDIISEFKFSGRLVSRDSLYQNVGIIELSHIKQIGLQRKMSFLRINKDSSKIRILVQFINRFSGADSLFCDNLDRQMVLYKNGIEYDLLPLEKVIIKRFSPAYVDGKQKLDFQE